MAVGGVRLEGRFQTEELTCVLGEGVRAWQVPGQQRVLVVFCSCSDAGGSWKGRLGLDGGGQKSLYSFLMAVGSH